MRETLDNMDRCDGVDDVTRQAASLYLNDDFKEVKTLLDLVRALKYILFALDIQYILYIKQVLK